MYLQWLYEGSLRAIILTGGKMILKKIRKLINNCLNTTGPANSGLNSGETSHVLLTNTGPNQNFTTKKVNKSLENLFKTQNKFTLQNNRQSSKGQKQTLSNSPKRQQLDGQ